VGEGQGGYLPREREKTVEFGQFGTKLEARRRGKKLERFLYDT
jgi:hypothetical protein